MKRIIDRRVETYTTLYILCVMLLSRNTLISSCVIGFANSFYILVVLSLPIIIIFINKMLKKQINMENIKKYIPLIIVIIISVIIKSDYQLYNISILFYIGIAFLISQIIEFNNFTNKYIKFMVILSVYSLIATYVIKPIIFANDWQDLIYKSKFIITNSANNNFFNLGLAFVFFDNNYTRNFGVFNEPSFYQFYLIIAIIFLLFDDKQKNKKTYNWLKISILTITVISTQSTAGYVVLLLLIIIYLLKIWLLSKKENKKKISIIVSCIIILLTIILLITGSLATIKSVIKKLFTSNPSSISRYGSVKFTLKKFCASPLWGNKLKGILEYKYMLTNTTLTLAAIYGFIPMLYSIYFVIEIVKKFELKQKIVIIGIILVMLLGMNSHLYIGVSSFWILILSGMMKKEEGVNEYTLDS